MMTTSRHDYGDNRRCYNYDEILMNEYDEIIMI